jgi:signal transduction histidine kinase
MMNWADYNTLLVVAGVVYWSLPVVVWLTLGRPRDTQSILWFVGGFSSGTGLLLTGYRLNLEPVVGYVLAPLLTVTGPIMLAQALRIQLKNDWSDKLLLSMMLFYGVVLWLLLAYEQTYALSVLVRAVNFLSITLLAGAAWSIYRYEGSRNALLICVTFAVLAFGVWLNVVSSVLGLSDIMRPEDSGLSSVPIFISILAAVVAYMAHLSMELERSLKADVSLRMIRKRAEFFRKRNQMLAVLDRQQTMSVLADSLGHSMLQPLAATQLSIDLLKRKLESPTPDVPTIRKLLSNVLIGVQSCGNRVMQIREFIRPSKMQIQDVELQSVVIDAQTLMRQEAMNRGIEWNLYMPMQPVRVRADPMQLTHAMVHLIRNALEALEGKLGGSIEIDLSATADQATLTVRDNGPGFAPHFMMNLQNNQLIAKTTSPSLGLPMVQGILEQFKGKLLIQNLLKGTGAKVSITLPL